jgi:glycosyltransferase involved in cell wall biosynthesis
MLVTQFAPPAGFSAARRTAGLAKYLTRLGHRVTVLTSLASGRGPMHEATKVIRTRDLTVSALNWRRGHFESVRGDGPAAGYADRPSRLAAVVVPDLMLVAWLPFALTRAASELRSRQVDCVITTSPPESTHLIGLGLKRLFGRPWVADLQDGWTFESTHPEWPLAAQRRLDSALEQAVARSADLVTTVTHPLTEDLRRRTGARAMTLTNGFDPEEHVVADKWRAGLREDRFSLVYTGRLAFARSTPTPLLDALRVLKRTRPELAERLEVVFAGPLTDEERGQMEESEVRDCVRAVGNLERADALALQRAADALLLVIPPARARSVATAKLYEYIAAGRPILVLGETNAAADTVRAAGLGVVAPAEDPDRIATTIAGLMHGDAAPAGADAAAAERFGYPAIARALAVEMERLCGGYA